MVKETVLTLQTYMASWEFSERTFSGKSSIIDGLLYTMFNTTSKNERKNYNIINQNRKDCRGVVELQVGEKIYRIERDSTKYVKKLKGEVTNEARTNLDFSGVDPVVGETVSLNGTTRNETDAHIRKRFGTVEDFPAHIYVQSAR